MRETMRFTPFHELSPYNPPRRRFLRWRTTSGGVSMCMRRNRQRVGSRDRSSDRKTPTEVMRSRNRKDHHRLVIADFERGSSLSKLRPHVRFIKEKSKWRVDNCKKIGDHVASNKISLYIISLSFFFKLNYIALCKEYL